MAKRTRHRPRTAGEVSDRIDGVLRIDNTAILIGQDITLTFNITTD